LKSELSVWLMLMVAVGLGSVAAAGVAGCQDEDLEREAKQRLDAVQALDGNTPAVDQQSAMPLGGSGQSYLCGTTVPSEDWSQWGGSSLKNNNSAAVDIPTGWNVGKFDRRTGLWDKSSAENIRWIANLGSLSYSNPVVSGGRLFIGTNNGSGYLARYPKQVDLGCLLCFDEASGAWLWQHSSEKLSTGRTHDWPLQGMCSTVLVEAGRVYFVTSRGEVCCVTTAGSAEGESEVVWVVDMMKELGISQVNMCASSATTWGDWLFVNTGNGFDEGARQEFAASAASFLCLNKADGTIVWTDNSPGENVLHGQWSSPAVAELGGEVQVLFAGGDGWLYSFAASAGREGKPELLWKFDCNPKESEWRSGGSGDRNHLIATPMVHDGLVYIAVGQDPEAGSAEGCLWCIDPTKRGDVSAELVIKEEGGTRVTVAARRLQAVDLAAGEQVIANPESAVVWKYVSYDVDRDGKLAFEEQMHRTLSTATASGDLVYVVDIAGIVHCLAAKGDGQGQPVVHFTYDMAAAVWGSALIADGHVFVGDEDGDVAVFALGSDRREPIAEINMGASIYSTPAAANGTLFISTKDRLFAIGEADRVAGGLQ
jgi:hypothetical protein